MEPLSFIDMFVHEVVFAFSDSFVQKTTQRSDGSSNARSDSQISCKYSKNSLFLSATTCEMYIVSKDYCIAHHQDQMCFLTNCSFHILLLGNVQELLQKLDPLCFTYQRVDCTYTISKYRFSGNIAVRSGQVFDNVQRANHFNQRSREEDKILSIAKKRHLRKKNEIRLLSSFRKTKSTQTSR